MILIFHSISREQAAWILIDPPRHANAQAGGVNGGVIKYQHSFAVSKYEDKVLVQLDIFLAKHKISFKKIKGIILVVKDASLTQVKVYTTIINTMAWHFKLPVIGSYYFKEDFTKYWSKLFKQLAKVKTFKPPKIKYQRKPDITVSKKSLF